MNNEKSLQGNSRAALVFAIGVICGFLVSHIFLPGKKYPFKIVCRDGEGKLVAMQQFNGSVDEERPATPGAFSVRELKSKGTPK